MGLEHARGEARRRRLPVRPHHVDGAVGALRRPEHGEQPPHALEAEAHAEQLEPEDVLLGLLERPGHAASSSSSACSRASLSRSACTTSGLALVTNPWLESLRSANAI